MIRIALILIVAAAWEAGLAAQDSPLAAEHADKAAELVRRGDLKGAEAELRTAVSLAPRDPDLLTSLGGVLGLEGDLRQANVYLARAVHLKPRDPLMLRNLAANEWQLGRLSEAHQHLDQLLQANPSDKGAAFLLGMVCENQKEYARSIALLDSIPDVVERRPEALVALASSYYHTDHREDAASVLKKLAGMSTTPQVKFMAARVAMEAQEYAIAESLLSPIKSDYADPAAVAAQLALAQYHQGHGADSERTLHEAFEAGHVNQEAYLLLCKLLADRGEYPQALHLATEAVQRFPGFYEALSTKGALEMKLEYFSAAVATLKKAAELRPSSTAQRELALAEWRAGNRAEAITGFEEAIRQFPDDADNYQTYGTLLLEDASSQSRSRAIQLFQRAVALDGAAVEAHFQLANLALADGRLQEALQHLDQALPAAPGDSRLHFALSRVYRRLGRDADADREMEEYRRLKK